MLLLNYIISFILTLADVNISIAVNNKLHRKHNIVIVCAVYILTIRKIGHLNIKTKIFDFEARVLIGWLANTLASQPIRTSVSCQTFLLLC